MKKIPLLIVVWIPAIIASNPRNHISVDASVGLTVGGTPLHVNFAANNIDVKFL